MDQRLRRIVIVYSFMLNCTLFLFMFLSVYSLFIRKCTKNKRAQLRYSLKSRIPSQIRHLSRIIELSDTACVANLRMTRDALRTLCYLLEHSGGLKHSRNVCLEEKVVMFLSILAHHKKIRIISHDFQRSSETISKHFHEVLSAVLSLHKILLVTPKPIDEGCIDEKWQPFKGCVGALDGTYVHVRVSVCEHARYRNHKLDISVNVLGACDTDMKFTYLLPGWEGSAADNRVLRDALSRPHGLRVPKGMEDSIHVSRHGKGKKIDNRRRTWTTKEEEALIRELHEVVNKGWKSDIGFRPGYLQHLEARMSKAFPNTDLKGEPHINSKLTVWKRQHTTLITLLSKSGIEWNDKEKMITVKIEDVYQQHCKVDKEARKMRFKSFPYLEDWNIIFGKDRAMGEFAEDIQEAVKRTRDAQNFLIVDDVEAAELPLEMTMEDEEQDNVETSSCNQPKRKGKRKMNVSKRSKSSDVEMQQNMVDILRQFSEGMQEKLAYLVTSMSYEFELTKKREEIFSELGKIEWLGLEDRILVSNYFSNNNNALQLIFTLPQQAKESMVKMIIEGKLK